MDRFEIIRNKALKDFNEMQEKLDKQKTKESDLLEKAKSLKDRVNYLIDLANECIENGINIGQKYLGSFSDYYHYQDYFLTDGWAHYTGFWYDSRLKKVVAIGCEGGGACHFDVKLNYNCENIVVDGSDGYRELEEILNREFDRFEKKFLSYIDSMA